MQQIRLDAIAALVSLGHKKREAARMVDAAINADPNISSASQLVVAAYKAASAAPKESTKAESGGYGLSYLAYRQGASVAGSQAEIVRIARAVGPGLTHDEFKALAMQVEAIEGRRGSMTNAAYQAALWAIPDAFKAGRRDPVHFQPTRDASGAPVDVPTADAGASSGDLAPAMPPEIPDAAQSITAMLNAEPTDPPSTVTSTLDRAQSIADTVGVFDQTGVTDLANAGVSLGRAFAEPGRAGEHLTNAAISTVSAIPVVGDVAKLAKPAASAAAAGSTGRSATNLAGGAPQPVPSKARFGSGGVNAAAQAAMVFLGMGGSGGGSGGGGNGTTAAAPGSPGQPQPAGTPNIAGGGGAGGPSGLDTAQKGIENFGGAIEGFLNKVGAGGAVLATVGSAIYERTLKPLVQWFKDVDAESKAMLESQRKFAELNGQMAGIYQRLDTDRFRRDIDQAGAMAGSTGRLASAQSGYEQAQQNLTQPYQKLAIDMQAWSTNAATWAMGLIDSVDIMGNTLDLIYGSIKEERQDKTRNDAEKAFQDINEKVAPNKVDPPVAAPPAPAANAPFRAPFNRNKANFGNM